MKCSRNVDKFELVIACAVYLTLKGIGKKSLLFYLGEHEKKADRAFAVIRYFSLL